MKFIFVMLFILICAPLVSAYQINTSDHILISSGDDAIITGTAKDGSVSGYMWLYTGNYENLVYGDPITVTNKSNYTAIINKSLKLDTGKYKLVLQFAGKNNVQEVLFDKVNTKLYSPWIYVKPLGVSENIAAIPNKIEPYCKDNIKYCDDTFVNTTIIVEGPFIKFTDQYQVQGDVKDITKNSLLYVGGITNLDTKNVLNVTLDYTQTVKANITYTEGDEYYRWHAYLNISRLRAGDHTILIESNKTDNIKNILTISEYIPTVTATPTPIRYVRNEMKQFVPVTNSPNAPRITVTPIIVNESNQQFVPVITTAPVDTPVIATLPPGAQYITPIRTNVVREPVLPTTEPGKLPSNIMVPIIGCILIILIMRKSDR